MSEFIRGFAALMSFWVDQKPPKVRAAFVRDDLEAMRKDWEAVGLDLLAAGREYRDDPRQLSLFEGR